MYYVIRSGAGFYVNSHTYPFWSDTLAGARLFEKIAVAREVVDYDLAKRGVPARVERFGLAAREERRRLMREQAELKNWQGAAGADDWDRDDESDVRPAKADE